jgi:ring-1,2-phenylacetyl-CoA epoxidase subunit PaaE
MSIHFHQLVVKEVKKETPDCISVSFHVPEELKETFAYTQGQNITLKKVLNGEEVRRSYSICTSPKENLLKVAIKKAEAGFFSTWANENLKPGNTLDVLPPTGKFYTLLEPSHKKNYLAFAAGSGITPVISIIKSTLQTETQSSFTLVYGNRTRSSIIFFEELEGLKNKYMERLNLIHVLSREKTDVPVNSGRINADKCFELKQYLVDVKSMDEIFICGPEQMIFEIKEWLEKEGIDKRKIHFELFTAQGQRQSAVLIRKSAAETGPKSKITVKLDGRSFDFDLAFNSISILDAALKQGADLPYACKGGMCATCKARVTEGEVNMDVNWALDEEEVKEGFVLTCQSHPKTETVVVDYDMR